MNEFGYIPHTDADKKAMLEALALESTEALFADIPDDIRLQQPLALKKAMSELEVMRHLEKLADKNAHLGRLVSFLGLAPMNTINRALLTLSSAVRSSIRRTRRINRK